MAQRQKDELDGQLDQTQLDNIGPATTGDAMQERYLKANGCECPFCRGSDVQGLGAVEVDDGKAKQDMFCDDCGKAWIDHYRLERFEGNP